MKKIMPLITATTAPIVIVPTVLASCSCSICFAQHNFINDGKYNKYEPSIEPAEAKTFTDFESATKFYLEAIKKDPLIIANDLLWSNDLGEEEISPSYYKKYFLKITVNEIDPEESRVSYTVHGEVTRDSGKTIVVTNEEYKNIKSTIVYDSETKSLKLVCSYKTYQDLMNDDKFSVNISYLRTSEIEGPADQGTKGDITNKSSEEDIRNLFDEYLSKYFRINPSYYLKNCKVNNN